MSLQDKINQAKKSNKEKMQGGWWLPEAEDNIDELLEQDSNDLYKSMLVKGIEKTKGKFGNQYLVRFIDLDEYMETGQAIEKKTPIRGNLISLIAKLNLGIKKSVYDLEDKELLDEHQETKKELMQEVEFDSPEILKDFAMNIRYCGKMTIQSGEWEGQKSHVFTGEKIDLTNDDVEEVLDEFNVPF